MAHPGWKWTKGSGGIRGSRSQSSCGGDKFGDAHPMAGSRLSEPHRKEVGWGEIGDRCRFRLMRD